MTTAASSSISLFFARSGAELCPVHFEKEFYAETWMGSSKKYFSLFYFFIILVFIFDHCAAAQGKEERGAELRVLVERACAEGRATHGSGVVQDEGICLFLKPLKSNPICLESLGHFFVSWSGSRRGGDADRDTAHGRSLNTEFLLHP